MTSTRVTNTLNNSKDLPSLPQIKSSLEESYDSRLSGSKYEKMKTTQMNKDRAVSTIESQNRSYMLKQFMEGPAKRKSPYEHRLSGYRSTLK